MVEYERENLARTGARKDLGLAITNSIRARSCCTVFLVELMQRVLEFKRRRRFSSVRG